MNRSAPRLAMASTLALLALGAAAARAADEPHLWAVTGVAANDVLHMRDVPSADSRSLATIPPNGRGLKHLGCRRSQAPFEQWARMSPKRRAEALTEWCRVEYRGQQGWVAGRFLKKDAGPAQ